MPNIFAGLERPAVAVALPPVVDTTPIETAAQFKAAIAQPVRSLEALNAILDRCQLSSMYGRELRPRVTAAAKKFFPSAEVLCGGTNSSVFPSNYPETRWWAYREFLRACAGVYQLLPIDDIYIGGSTLEAIYHTQVHMSLREPGRIAYTASIPDGEQDRQRTTTLTKFLRDLPRSRYLTDHALVEMEQSLVAALNCEVEILPSDKIAETIRIAGLSSCMRYTTPCPDFPGLTEDEHPCDVYDAPGFGIAVHRVDGRIAQRTIVYVNPEDETDKRYVRLYGDGPLARKLTRLGYRCADLLGAKLRAIPLSAYEDRDRDDDDEDDDDYPRDELAPGEKRYLMAYLDGAGTRNNGTSVALSECGNWLEVVNDAKAAVIQRIAQHQAHVVTSAAVTRGSIVLRPVPSRHWTCPLSGVRYDLVSDPIDRVQWVASVEAKPVAVALQSLPSDCHRLRTYVGDGALQVYAPVGTAQFSDSFSWVDTPANRMRRGYALLDPMVYPGGPVWERNTIEVDGRRVRQEDTVQVLALALGDTQPSVTRMLSKDFAEVRKSYKITTRDGETIYVPRTVTPVETIVRSDGTTAPRYKGLHAIAETYDGKMVASKLLTARSWMGQNIIRMKDKGVYAEHLKLDGNTTINVAHFVRQRFRWGSSSWTHCLSSVMQGAYSYTVWPYAVLTADINELAGLAACDDPVLAKCAKLRMELAKLTIQEMKVLAAETTHAMHSFAAQSVDKARQDATLTPETRDWMGLGPLPDTSEIEDFVVLSPSTYPQAT